MSKRKVLAPQQLIDDVVTEMIEYLPKGSYRYIGGVSRQFRDSYQLLHRTASDTTFEESIRSLDRAIIWVKEKENYEICDLKLYLKEAVRYGNVGFLMWLCL